MPSDPIEVAADRRTGRAELDEHVQGVESAEIDVDLRIRQRSKEKVLEEIRQKVTLLPGMNVSIGQPISHRIDHMLSGTRASIAVKIFGDDLTVLRNLAKEVQAVMAGVRGVVDLSIEQQTNIPTLRVKVDQASAARYGLQAGETAEMIETAFVGKEVNRILEGQFSFPLVVRYEGLQPGDPSAVEHTLIDTPSGAKIPLSAVAEAREDRGPNFIMREGVQRRIVVQCNVAGRDLRGVVNDIQKNGEVSASLHDFARLTLVASVICPARVRRTDDGQRGSRNSP